MAFLSAMDELPTGKREPMVIFRIGCTVGFILTGHIILPLGLRLSSHRRNAPSQTQVPGSGRANQSRASSQELMLFLDAETYS